MKGSWRARRKDGSKNCRLSRCGMICCWSVRRCRQHGRNYPVRDIKIICHHEVHGLEIQISSTSADNTNVWVVISRGSHRYVDDKDPENSHEEADHECMPDTDQEQPIFNWKCRTITFRFMEGNKWKDIRANEFSCKYTWESQTSKFVSKLVRHENCRDREIDGAIHSKLILPKIIVTFQRDGSHEFADRHWINCILESNETRFQYCQNFRNKLLYVQAVQGHTGRDLIEPEVVDHVFIRINWKQFAFHQRRN